MNGASVLAFGGYGENRNACHLLRLEQDYAQSAADVNLHFGDDVGLDACTVIGRNSLIHVFTPTEWYSFAVPEA